MKSRRGIPPRVIPAVTWEQMVSYVSSAPVGPAAAGTLTGTTLASNVVTSSLTTIGTLVGGTVPAARVSAGTLGAGAYTLNAGNVAVALAVTVQRSTVGASVSGLTFVAWQEASSGTAADVKGLVGFAANAGSGTVTNLYGVQAQVIRYLGTVTNGFGLHVVGISSAMANAYGLYIEDITGGTSLNRAIRTGLGPVSLGDVVAVGGAAVSTTTALIVPAGTTGVSSLRVPHGVAPTSPVDGDWWSTTTGFYGRVNGSTVGPFGAGGGSGLTHPQVLARILGC